MESNEWYKVDNVAKVFLSSYNRRDTRCLRVSCTLKEPINPILLTEALMATIRQRPLFQVRIRRGFFWHYIEPTGAVPVVEEEHRRPCPLLYGPGYKGILHYEVTYYGCRINFDIFHALSDGTGALDYLNSLVTNYLKLAHPADLADYTPQIHSSEDMRQEDSFEHYYESRSRVSPGTKVPRTPFSYHIKGGCLPYNQLQFFRLSMPTEELMDQVRAHHTTVTVYLGSLMMLAIRSNMPAKEKDKPVTISIPVNLRSYFESETSRNFFNNVYVSHTFTGEETLDSLIPEFDQHLREALTPEIIRKQMNSFSRLEHLVLMRLVPLAIKIPVIRFFSRIEDRKVTAVISNLGRVAPAQELTPYIEDYSAYCSHNGLFTTVTSFGGQTIMGFCSAYRHTDVLMNFIHLLRKEGLTLTVYASEVFR